VVVRLHRAGGYGGLFGNVNRHCFLGFDYDGSSPSAGDSANANAISHAARVQIAEFFANRGGTVRDPDPNGDVYFEAQGSGGAHLDVFGVFAGDADLEEMMKDPHLE
jgi:hypothetical protein